MPNATHEWMGLSRLEAGPGLGKAFVFVQGLPGPIKFLGWGREAPGRMEYWLHLGLLLKRKLRPVLV